MTETSADTRGVTDRIFAAYGAMRKETLALLALRPSEGVILSFFMIAGLAMFCGRMVNVMLEQRLKAGSDTLQGEIGAALIGSFLLLPLGAYLLTVLIAPLARLGGGNGGFYGTRLAIGWSSAVAFPVILLLWGVDAAAKHGFLNEPATFVLKLPLSALWVYFLASALAAAHGFRSAKSVLSVTALGACAIFAAAVALRGLT